MLCSTASVTTKSNVPSAKGSRRASPSLTSTRSDTPSSRAFSCVASGRLPDRSSACQMSTPDRLPGGQALGGADQEQAAAAADVEHRLVPSPGQGVEEPVALPYFFD